LHERSYKDSNMGTYPLSNKQGHEKKFLQKNLKYQGVR
jgi:hypothetical protein